MAENRKFDLIIVGGGISGTAMLYTLCKYTDLKKVCIIEKYQGFGTVNSSHLMNSQTLHFGDIETNYTLAKATTVKRSADMVKNYLEAEKIVNPEAKLFSKYDKMVMAVGTKQVQDLDTRFESFSKLFPKLRKIGREEIGKLEPRVLEGRDPNEDLRALVTEDGYTVDFGALSRNFIQKAQELNPELEIFLETKLSKITDLKTNYKLETNKGVFEAEVVLICAGGHSIVYAKSLGYGKHFAILSMAGSFYTAPKVLNGKVYTMQNDKLPFAAIHGDPEVHNANVTRFGPTAKTIYLLERYNYPTWFEYLKVFGFTPKAIMTLFKIASDWTILKYLLKNFLYDLPFIGKRSFLKEIRKIVPNIKASEIKYAKHVGGTRPQIVNNDLKKLEMGEAKLTGRNIIFNITPSPGASTCLGNAYNDAQTVMGFLGGKYTFDKAAFENDLLDK
ncbi:MAG: FAD-dependent oxidoreductase [Bacteroidota bacterium]